MFVLGGRRITWFAQRRQTIDSPVIARLIHDTPRGMKREGVDGSGWEFGAAAGSSQGGSAPRTPTCQVVLWCRLPGEPYVFCGRLHYVTHDPTTSPLRFVWELADFDLLTSGKRVAVACAGGGVAIPDAAGGGAAPDSSDAVEPALAQAGGDEEEDRAFDAIVAGGRHLV